MKSTSHKKGFVGLLVLLVAVGIIIYLMAKQFESYAQSKAKQSDLVTPIDRAEEARDILEGRSRGW